MMNPYEYTKVRIKLFTEFIAFRNVDIIQQIYYSHQTQD